MEKETDQRELFSRGKEHLVNSDYLEAITVFNGLSKNNFGNGLREMLNLYSFLSVAIPYSIRPKQKENPEINDSMINQIITYISTATNKYSEGEISKEELFTIETLIDRIPFRDMRISHREEFEKIYCRFKEYALDVFLGKR